MRENKQGEPVSILEAGRGWCGEYIPIHCAANGLDLENFTGGESEEPEPAVCPHCGEKLRYPALRDPVTGDFWGWRPLPETCANPRCQEIARQEREQKDHERRLIEYNARLKLVGYPEDLLGATVRTYKPRNPSQKKALDQAREFIGAMGPGPLPSGGLCLCGPTGTGKSHLAASIAKAAVWYGHGAKFVRSAQLVKSARVSDADDDPLAVYVNTALLVIDDIGKEYPTPWALMQLEDVISARLAARRPTIFTSNYALNGKGAGSLFTALSSHGDADRAQCIVSRIRGRASVAIVLGSDYRADPEA